MEEKKKSSAGIVWAVVILILAVAVYGGYKYIKKDSSSPEQTVTPNPVPTETTTSYLYKDGSYSTIGEYLSPAGEEQIGVQITLKDDVITDVAVEAKTKQAVSIKFQTIFVENFKPVVVGKKLDEVNLDKVSGSSLTPKGFNDAVAKIKVQAKA